MERKIGEIFEYNGEWHQCVYNVHGNCDGCSFSRLNSFEYGSVCCESYLVEMHGKCGKVIFKKLEKIGESFYSKHLGKSYQRYKTYIPAVGNNFKIRVEPVEHVGRNEIFIEIKQNKEDMEEKKQKLDDLVGLYSSAQITYKEFDKELKALYTKQWEEDKPVLKPFNLEEAKEGKPVCTRDGRKARIVCFDSKNDPKRPIVALVENNGNELLYEYTIEGKERFSHISTTGTSDLMMSPEKKEGWVNLYKSSVHSTKEEAMKYRNKCNDYIDTIKIEWEE